MYPYRKTGYFTKFDLFSTTFLYTHINSSGQSLPIIEESYSNYKYNNIDI